MKKLKFAIFLITLILIIIALYVNADTQLTEEQIKAFRSARTVKIVVEQSYGAEKDVSLPFEEVARRFLEYAGLKVVGSGAKDFDLRLKIEAKGQASGATYKKMGYRYTGATIYGWISLEIQGAPVYKKAFKGVQETTKVMLQGKSSAVRISEYKTPSDAPFRSAFDKPDSFISKILQVIGEIYGINPIISALRDQEYSIRDKAVAVLMKLNEARAVEPLMDAIGDEDWNVRKRVISVLSVIRDSRAVEPLIAALKDEYSEVRESAVKALGKINDQRAAGHLVIMLEDRAWKVREGAAEALGKLKDKSAVGPLIAILEDKDWHVRRKAVEALGEINDSRAVGPLVVLRKDVNSLVRQKVAIVLDKLGWIPEDNKQRARDLIARYKWNECVELGEPAVEPLITALKDKSHPSRANIAKTLGMIKDKRAVEPLIAVLKDKKEYSTVQEEVIKALGKMNDSRVIEPLIAALGDDDGLVRRTAAEVLGKLREKRAVKPLIVVLNDKDRQVRWKTAEALGRVKDRRAVGPLIIGLGDKDSMVRAYAAKALGEIRDIKAVEPLIELLKDKQLYVRQKVADALENITLEDFGVSHSRWKKWWEKNKDKYLKKK